MCRGCSGCGYIHGERCVACAGKGASDSMLTVAVEALTYLRRMAADPMKSWDAGRVIDAQRVDEICEEALEKLQGAE
jgi:hypothetical protein